MFTSSYFDEIKCMINWLYFENHKNGIRPRANNPLATFSEFPCIYRPGSQAYNIPLFNVPVKNCRLFYSNSADEALKNYYFKNNSVNFPVHPVNLDNSSVPNIDEILKFSVLKYSKVHPTSSTRTVFIMDNDLPPHCVKGHTDLKITRWRRHMEMRKIIQAITVTSLFEEASIFHNYSKFICCRYHFGDTYTFPCNMTKQMIIKAWDITVFFWKLNSNTGKILNNR